jgi:site-specific recombinase XerD
MPRRSPTDPSAFGPNLKAFHQHVSQFAHYLRSESPYSSTTIQGYGNDLFDLLDYLAGTGSDLGIHCLDGDILRPYWDQQAGRRLSSSTRKRRLAAIRCFNRFLVRKGVLKREPLTRMHGHRIRRPIPVLAGQSQDSSALQEC